MARKKDKKGKKKKKGDDKSSDLKLSPYIIRISHVITTLKLLESPEEHIVFLSTCSLDGFINKYGKPALLYLEENQILPKLVTNLTQIRNIRVMTLKLIIKLFDVDSTLPALQSDLTTVTKLINIFMESDDNIELEYSSNIIGKVCVEETCAELLCTDSIIQKLFNTIVTKIDPDIKRNCLTMLYCIVSCRTMKEKVAESPAFKVCILNLVLEGPFTVLRPDVVEILIIISDYDSKTMQNQLLESSTVLYLFDIIVEQEWADIQNKCLTVIYNCMKHNPVQIKSLESKKFLHMVNLAKDLSPDHALGVIALITEFAKSKENLQVLVNFGVHDVLSDFCKFDDIMIYVKFCEAISEFTKNCHIIPELANKSTMHEIKRLMRQTNLPWAPYRQAGIRLLYLFLINNPRISILYYQCNLIEHIQEALALPNRYYMEHDHYLMALKIYQIMLKLKCLHQYLWTEDIFYIFVQLLEEYDAEIVRVAIDVVQNTLCSNKFREWFLEMDGIDKVFSLLLRKECEVIDEVLAFIKCLTSYVEMSVAIFRAGMVQEIQEFGENSFRHKCMCEKIVDDIYRCELSIKFYITGILDYNDIVKNGFCVFIGFKPERDLPKEENVFSKLSFTYTAITVNFHGKNREKLPAALRYKAVKDESQPRESTDSKRDISTSQTASGLVSQPKAAPRASYDRRNTATSRVSNTRTSVKKRPTASVTGIESRKSSVGSTKRLSKVEKLSSEGSKNVVLQPKMIYKLEIPVPLDEEPMDDYYLKKHLKDARKILAKNENDTVIKKITALAKFVVNCLNGHDGEIPKKHQFETHISELKKKLLTNYIPLGYLRLGTMMERALLFKVLADRLQIPCSLHRGDGTAWNEVFCSSQKLNKNFIHECVVDLMDNIGKLLVKGTKYANFYCSQANSLDESDDSIDDKENSKSSNTVYEEIELKTHVY